MPTICIVPICPMRLEPSHRSEMISQLLFGESLEILEEVKEGWIKVKCNYDAYEGWVSSASVINAKQWNDSNEIAGDYINKVMINGQQMLIPFGAILPAENNLTIENKNCDFSKVERRTLFDKIVETDFLNIAYSYLNTAYLWGGKSVFGIDCSGYTQQVFKFFNIKISRDAYLQAEMGESIGFLQETKLGDLAFFDNTEGKITHVGILLNHQQIIHASGKVRIDKIDNEGITHSDTGIRTHRLRLIKRYF